MTGSTRVLIFREINLKTMSIINNEPYPLSENEWQEIMQIQEVRESWGLENETVQEFKNMVYAVKFNFISGSPGYVGDLYILQGDVLTGDRPFFFGRREGKLYSLY